MPLNCPVRRPHQIAIALIALPLLPLVALAVRRWGYQRVHGALGRRVPTHRRHPHPSYPPEMTVQIASRLGAAVNRAALLSAPGGACLTRSLTLWWLLARRGIESEVVIAVRIADRTFGAHAWVECHQVPVNDRPDIMDEFRPIWRSGSPGTAADPMEKD